jgi:hypothetical protein
MSKPTSITWENLALAVFICYIIAWPSGFALRLELGPGAENANNMLSVFRVLAVIFFFIKARYLLPFVPAFFLAEYVANYQFFWPDVLGFCADRIYQSLGEWAYDGSKLWLLISEPNCGLFGRPLEIVHTFNLEFNGSELTDLERGEIWGRYRDMYGYGWYICQDSLTIINALARYLGLLALALPVATMIGLRLRQGRDKETPPLRNRIKALFQNLNPAKYLCLFLLFLIAALFALPYIHLLV